jgi:diphosphomevalonate decarboxylase
MSVTATAHPNIALVKYWGKRDTKNNLPAVSSLSLTLDTFATTTQIQYADTDRVILNGADAPSDFSARVLLFLNRVALDRRPCLVTTHNNFPTAAGLASSASGFAALALAGSTLLHDTALDLPNISKLARLGSGSATRSLFGGFVQWDCGTREDGSDAIATQIADRHHWNDIRMVVAVASNQKKSIGSTEAMERSRLTSPLYQAWLDGAEADVKSARDALLSHNLEVLGATMERSTMKMYATMTTATPPILYWSPQTVAVLHAVWDLRARGISAWCTMDAGPNVKILCEAANAESVAAAVTEHVITTHTLRAGGGAYLVHQ